MRTTPRSGTYASQVHMLVHAPAADITLSGPGELWGALVGNRVEIDGRVHHDKALSAGFDGSGGFARYERVAFREMSR